MIRLCLVFILTFSLWSCVHKEDKLLIEQIKTKDENLAFIGKAGPEYYFNRETISGEPFTDSFLSTSQVVAYIRQAKGLRRTVDTTFIASNSYSDIKLDLANSTINNDLVKLAFVQCPDGDDSCINSTFSLPTLTHCPNCR